MSRTRDFAIANEVLQPVPNACGADGCPNRWSVDAGNGRACSAHAWAPRRDWPAITQRQQWDDVERHRPVAPKLVRTPKTHEAKTEILHGLRAAANRLAVRHDGQDKAWAHALRASDEANASLTVTQRAMWREALHEPPPIAAPRLAAPAIVEPDFFDEVPAFEENDA